MAAVITDDRPSAPPPDRPPRQWVRRTWRIGGCLFAVVVLGFGTMQSVAQLAHEEHTVVRHFDGAALRVVDVRNGAGSVHIVGTEGDRVTVRAWVSDGLRATGESTRMEGDRLVLRSSCPVIGSNFCEVRYTVSVPEDVDVRVRADARISVSDVTGNVEASTDGGRVEASRIVGNVELYSDNGRVVGTDLRSGIARADSDNGRVELGFLAPPRTVSATSDNGSVEVVLPETTDDYRIEDVSSDNGTAATPEININPDSDRTVTATSDNGDVTVRYASR